MLYNKQKGVLYILLAVLIFPRIAHATAYTYPTNFPPQTVPFSMTGTDTLTVNTGSTMTASTGGFTIQDTESDGFLGNITIQSGATVSYTGTGGNTIKYVPGAASNSSTYTLNLNGVLSAPSGQNAIQIDGLNVLAVTANINGASAGNGIVNGNILVINPGGGIGHNIFVDGLFAQINGDVTLNTSPTATDRYLSLTFGSNSPTNFVSNGNFTLVNTPVISAGSFTLSSGNQMSTNNFTVNTGATARINGTLNLALNSFTGQNGVSNSGTMFLGQGSTLLYTATGSKFFTNSNNLNIATNFNTTAFFFDNSGALYLLGSGGITGNVTSGTSFNVGQDSTGATNSCNFVTNGTIDSIPIVHVYSGSLTSTTGNTISNVNTSFTLDPGTTATLGEAITGSGLIANSGTLILNVNNALGLTGALTNNASGKIYVAQTFTPSTYASLTNNGGIYVYGASGNIAGAFSGGVGSSGSLYYGKDANNVLYNNTYALSGNVSNTPNLRVFAGTLNSGVFTVSGVSGGFTIDPGATATFASSYAGTGAITNNGTLNIGAAFGSGTITNNLTLSLTNGANLSSNIVNTGTMSTSGTVSGTGTVTNNGGTLTVNGTYGSGAITNNAQLILANNSNTTAAINNANTLTVQGSATAGTISGSGVTNVAANTLHTTAFSTSGTVNINLASPSSNGKITATNSINLSSGFLAVTSSTNTNNTWTVLDAGAPGQLVPPLSSNVTFPSSGSLFAQWSSFADPTLRYYMVQRSGNVTFSSLATDSMNQSVAQVLDGMSAHVTNSGQQTLLNALLASTTAQQLNNSLSQLLPNLNAMAPNIAMQNAVFRKIETRIAALRNNFDVNTFGINAGDCKPSTGLWLSGFGSIAKLRPSENNTGYKSKSYGAILGFDNMNQNDELFGMGIALSKTIAHDISNPSSVAGIEGYHALFYGTNYFLYDNFFEWLVTGAYTGVSGSRGINVSNVIMSTTSHTGGAQFALRCNYGKDMQLDNVFNLLHFITSQYVGLFQPEYQERYSPAALKVKPAFYQNVLTIGGGTKFVIADDEWTMGNSELRVLGTYDLISSRNNVTSSFLVGSSNFMLNTPAGGRLALKTGLDLHFSVSDHLSLQFSYEYELRAKYYDNSGTIKIKFIF